MELFGQVYGRCGATGDFPAPHSNVESGLHFSCTIRFGLFWKRDDFNYFEQHKRNANEHKFGFISDGGGGSFVFYCNAAAKFGPY